MAPEEFELHANRNDLRGGSNLVAGNSVRDNRSYHNIFHPPQPKQKKPKNIKLFAIIALVITILTVLVLVIVIKLATSNGSPNSSSSSGPSVRFRRQCCVVLADDRLRSSHPRRLEACCPQTPRIRQALPVARPLRQPACSSYRP